MAGDGAESGYGPDTALLIVDVQNDFASPDGSLSVPGGAEVVDPINDEIRAARGAGALVAYTQDWHPERTPHFVTDGGPWPVHCVGGTKGADLHPSLLVDGPVVRKGIDGGDGYSGFSVRDPRSGEEGATELNAILKADGVRRVVVVGLALDYCVRDTALDAVRLGYEVSVPADLTRAVNVRPGDGARAVAALVAGGVTVR
jgi:nicotinamidase/pyrazinamidase